MTIGLAASCGRSIGVVVALVIAAAVVALPATAGAQTTQTTQTTVLAQGAGMGAQPSAAVRRIQRVLKDHGYRLGSPGVDGRFGPLTAAAVRRMQADYGLATDGVVGPKTRRLVGLLRDRARRSSPARRQSSQGKAAPAKTPAPAPEQPTTTPQPAPASIASDNNPGWGWLALVALVAAVAAFCTALTAMRRPRPAAPAQGDGAPIAPLMREPYVEGHSSDERVAHFRGHAFAATVTTAPGVKPSQADTWYLVDDARKRAPVWVRGADIQRSPSALATGEAVIGYVTVPAEGSPSQADYLVREIEQACRHAGWELAEVVTDRETGRGLERPGLSYALTQIAEGKARGLVVCELRKLTRSVNDLGSLLQWFTDARAGLIALDLGIDTSTPVGHETAAALITLGDWERQRVAQRTRSALAEVRASGRPVGRPAVSDRPDLLQRITAMRAANMTLQAIADQLNNEGVPTLRGGAMWRPSSVQAALGYRRPGTRTPRDQLPTLEDRA